MDELILEAVETQRTALEALAARWETGAVLGLAALALLGLGLLLILLHLAWQRRRGRKLEAWLEREVALLHEKLEDYARSQQEMLRVLQPPEPAQIPVTRPSPIFPARGEAVSVAPSMPPAEQPPATEEEVLASLNRLLAGNQPFNLIEALRALNPRLNLQRMTPRGNPDPWAQEVVLDHGGDGLFARVEQGRAWLYPNYNRFSTTLDPKPLFEDARHGARIHAVTRPALLQKRGDGAWVLREKGLVQMR